MFGLFNRSQSAKLVSIFICEAAGQPMKDMDTIMAIKNEGLLGDRYQTKKGYWDPVEGCQVTMITTHEIARANKKAPVKMESGQHRRNLVISLIHPKKLINKTIRIGGAVFRFHKPRPPCGYLDHLVSKGTAKALGKNSGYCITVIKGGRLNVGDDVLIIDDS